MSRATLRITLSVPDRGPLAAEISEDAWRRGMARHQEPPTGRPADRRSAQNLRHAAHLLALVAPLARACVLRIATANLAHQIDSILFFRLCLPSWKPYCTLGTLGTVLNGWVDTPGVPFGRFLRATPRADWVITDISLRRNDSRKNNAATLPGIVRRARPVASVLIPYPGSRASEGRNQPQRTASPRFLSLCERSNLSTQPPPPTESLSSNPFACATPPPPAENTPPLLQYQLCLGHSV